jgi:RNA polymerase sigma-70 factor, ECF subfamily
LAYGCREGQDIDTQRDADYVRRGLDTLRSAVAAVILDHRALAVAGPGGQLLLSEATVSPGPGSSGSSGGYDDSAYAASSEEDAADRTRGGDKDAFGLLYDHYQGSVYRFLFYRTRSTQLAEDLTSETFFRALRSMNSFRWQGKDFGAWLMTIARNLCTDHFKAGRTRLEQTTEDMSALDDTTEGPESAVLASLTNELLMKALAEIPDEQRDCLIMRFLQGLSIAETAAVLGRSDGAVKQLQLRGVRNLAKLMPEGVRDA